MTLKTRIYNQWQVDQLVGLMTLLDYEQKSRILMLMKNEIETMLGTEDIMCSCRCHFCKKDFIGLPRNFGIIQGTTTVCRTCGGYQAYLSQFPKEVRHRKLRNRRCVQCRVNKVGSSVQSRRVCESCRTLAKTAGRGESRAFFQMMAMRSVIEPVTGESE